MTAALEAFLAHRFSDTDLLTRALTHSSTTKTRNERIWTNERLEFLGDRVLGLIVSRMLYDRFPDEEEGELSRRFTALVRREALARVAGNIGLGEYLLLSPGEAETGGRKNPAILADSCEALIAALYLDAGLEAASNFVRTHWEPLMHEDLSPPKDAKTTLQEWSQARGLKLPAYRQMDRNGPDHAPVFTIEAALEGYAPAAATGPSKRTAEQAAAEALLTRVSAEEDS